MYINYIDTGGIRTGAAAEDGDTGDGGRIES
jgi:hypothetical protein